MRRYLLLILLIASVAVLPGTMRAEPPAAREYAGKDESLPVRFRLPAGWKVKESRGKVDIYHQVRLTGPRNSADTYTAFMVVRAFPLEAPDATEAETEAFVSRWIASLPAGATMSPRASRMLDGQPAEEFSAVFPVPTIHHVSRHPGPTPVKTRMVIQARPPLLFEVIYNADEREYPKHSHLFDALLDSLKLSK